MSNKYCSSYSTDYVPVPDSTLDEDGDKLLHDAGCDDLTTDGFSRQDRQFQRFVDKHANNLCSKWSTAEILPDESWANVQQCAKRQNVPQKAMVIIDMRENKGYSWGDISRRVDLSPRWCQKLARAGRLAIQKDRFFGLVAVLQEVFCLPRWYVEYLLCMGVKR